MNKSYFIIIAFLLGSVYSLSAQYFHPEKGCVVDQNQECIPSTSSAAMPFLRIAPDARSGAMGDVGLTTDADANSLNFNASNIIFAEDKSGVSFTLTPWLRELNLDDVYLFYGSAFTKLDEQQAIGFGIKYFSLGEIQYRTIDGTESGIGMPRDLEIAASYARKLGKNLSAALTGKYLYSNLATGETVTGIDLISAQAFAADISLTYKRPLKIGTTKGDLTVATAITNLGSKVSYRSDAPTEDFIPTNLGLGVGYKMDIDAYNSLSFSLEFNKLMVPSYISPKILGPNGTPIDNPDWDKNGDQIADYRQKGLLEGVFGSFNDAQGGFSEELKEITIGVGAEYWYNKQFAVRAGYFSENKLKGDRKFLTTGIGIKYNVFGINLSYLVPTTNQRNPLDNTLRFTLQVDLGGSNASEGA